MTLKSLAKGRRFRLSDQIANIDKYARDALYRVSIDHGLSKDFLHVCKEWHRPIPDIHSLRTAVLGYGCQDPDRCLDPVYFSILKQTMDEFRPSKKLIPHTLGAVVDISDFPRTRSPGFPWNTQGYKTKEEVLRSPEARGYIQREWDSIGRGVGWKLPDVQAFHRTVVSPKSKQKVRLTWGFPVDVIAEEARWFYPMWSHVKSVSQTAGTCYGVGLEIGLGGIQYLQDQMVTTGYNALCGDFSQFDSTVPGWLIRDVFAHMSDWFDFEHVIDREGIVWDVNPNKTVRRWKAMVSYFLSCSIRLPNGERFKKSKGVPSGSMFTNFIDTICNAVATRYACMQASGRLPLRDYYYGDDSCVMIKGLNVTKFADVLESTFGLKLNMDKTIYTCNPRNIHWLGYYAREGLPKRELDFLLASSVYPEKKIVHPVESCARLLGQLYSTMDPQLASIFWLALEHIRKRANLTVQAVEQFAKMNISKALKFLTVLGLSPSELELPIASPDPFSLTGLRINNVLPRSPSKRLNGMFDRHLLTEVGAPESYANTHIRRMNFYLFYDYYGFCRDEETSWSRLYTRSLL
uniref:RNA dependent RNA polymerase n=1 Tax=Plasmopara viticola lesion associated Partiti-like 1 TaxID=2689983 RepID=A0A6B9KNS1_9VIRU|nr:RNA dependent RNA polymerase [Plasmopara viticola lesion associated Partiti-like 1]